MGCTWIPSTWLPSYLALQWSSTHPYTTHTCNPSQLDPWPPDLKSPTSITSYIWPRHQPGFFLALFLKKLDGELMVSAILGSSQADLLICFERYTTRGLLWKAEQLNQIPSILFQGIVNLQHAGWRGDSLMTVLLVPTRLPAQSPLCLEDFVF